MHRFQSVSFPESSRPPQLVIGSSGVALDSAPPNGALTSSVDGSSADVLTTASTIYKDQKKRDAFAYLSVKLEKSGSWRAKLVDSSKKPTIAKCTSEQNLAQGVCEFAHGISVSK